MEQRAPGFEQRTEEYLKYIGIRPTTKAYQYLLFALVQLQKNTPFKNTIWELTAIYFRQTRKNVLSCIRQEITSAFTRNPSIFSVENFIPDSPPTYNEFLRLVLNRLRNCPEHSVR